MAATVLHHQQGASAVTSIQYAQAVTPGNLLLICVATGGSANTWSSVTDNINGAWTAIPNSLNNVTTSIQWWYYDNTGAGQPTVTISTSSQVILLEISGAATPVVFEGANNGNGNSAAPSVNVTTTTDGDLIIGGCQAQGLNPLAGTTPIAFTELEEYNTHLEVESYAQPTHGLIAVNFRCTSGAWVASAFGLAPPSGPPPTPTLYVNQSARFH